MPKWTVIVGILALTSALVLHYDYGFPLGPSLLVFFLGWPVVEVLVTRKDGLEGGWSLPDGSLRPPWKRARFWGRIALGLALGAAGFAIDAGKLS
jgi:hypothetical protein